MPECYRLPGCGLRYLKGQKLYPERSRAFAATVPRAAPTGSQAPVILAYSAS